MSRGGLAGHCILFDYSLNGVASIVRIVREKRDVAVLRSYRLEHFFTLSSISSCSPNHDFGGHRLNAVDVYLLHIQCSDCVTVIMVVSFVVGFLRDDNVFFLQFLLVIHCLAAHSSLFLWLELNLRCLLGNHLHRAEYTQCPVKIFSLQLHTIHHHLLHDEMRIGTRLKHFIVGAQSCRIDFQLILLLQGTQTEC